MNLKESLKELTKQGYNTLELCYIRGEIDYINKTCTVEPVNRPEFKIEVNHNGYEPNFIKAVKYSPTKANKFIEPASNSFVVVGFTSKNDGYILLTEAITKLTVSGSTGTVDFSIVEGKLRVEFTELLSKYQKTTEKGETELSGDRDIYATTINGSQVKYSEDIDLLSVGKIRIAKQKNRVINTETQNNGFLKDKGSLPDYEYLMLQLLYMKQMKDDAINLSEKLVPQNNRERTDPDWNKKIPYERQKSILLTLQDYALASTNYKDLDETYRNLYLSINASKELKESDYRVVIKDLSNKINALIKQDPSWTYSLPGYLDVKLPKLDKKGYDNFLEFEKMFINSTIQNKQFDYSAFLDFAYWNKPIIGWYYPLANKLIQNLDKPLILAEYIRERDKILQAYKDKFVYVLEETTTEEKVKNELQTLSDNIDNTSTEVNLKDILTQQNELIVKQNEIIKTLMDKINILATAGVNTGTGVMNGLTTFQTDVATITTDLTTNKNDLKKIVTEQIDVLLK